MSNIFCHIKSVSLLLKHMKGIQIKPYLYFNAIPVQVKKDSQPGKIGQFVEVSFYRIYIAISLHMYRYIQTYIHSLNDTKTVQNAFKNKTTSVNEDLFCAKGTHKHVE